MAILGISTNTRLVGCAIISEEELIEYFTHLHKTPWSPSKVTEIITSLEPCVRQYCIKRVVLSIPYAHYQTKEHQRLSKALIKNFENKHLEISTKTPAAIATLYPQGEKKRKKALMEAMSKRFPELRYCYAKEMRNKNKYYYKLFEAVAVAVLASEE